MTSFFLSFFNKIHQVRVNTVLGGAAPPLTVKLVRAFSPGSKGSAAIESKVSDGYLVIFLSLFCSIFYCLSTTPFACL